jgi:hypothetical protein
MEFLLLGRELEVALIMTKSRRCYAKQHLSGTGPRGRYVRDPGFSRLVTRLHESLHLGTPEVACLFPADPVSAMPREWVERAYADLRRFTEMPKGGHFAAMEEPELLAEDIRCFFRPLRQLGD